MRALLRSLAGGRDDEADPYGIKRKHDAAVISAINDAGIEERMHIDVHTLDVTVEAARQLLYYVCSEIDTGRRCDKEASMAKLFASEMAERVCSEAIQIHGGAGYTKHFQVERYWRDARLTKIFEGTSEIQQMIISDRILGRHRDPVAKKKDRGGED